MSINEIPLNEAIVTSLYTHHLVMNQTYASEDSKGTIEKSVTIVYGEPKPNKTMDMEFLGGILKACRLAPEDVAILENTNAGNMTELLSRPSGKLLIFGQHDDPIGADHFEPTLINSTQVLTAPALESISKDKELKMKLWNCLKSVFNIS